MTHSYAQNNHSLLEDVRPKVQNIVDFNWQCGKLRPSETNNIEFFPFEPRKDFFRLNPEKTRTSNLSSDR